MGTSPYTVIYSFGDSISDAGIAYLLTSSSAAALLGEAPQPVSPPYFQESYANPAIGGSTTANVFSNGPVWVQDLAAAYGLATPEPGEISGTSASFFSLLTTQGVSTSTATTTIFELEAATGTFSGDLQLVGIPGGTDFAIGGSVTGINTGASGVAVALTDLQAQLSYFQASIPTPAPNALYTIESGSNDLFALLEAPDFASLTPDAIASSIATSVTNVVSMVQALAADGAQSILVLNVGALAATPDVQALGATAIAAASSLVTTYNADLKTALAALSPSGAHVYSEDLSALFADAVQHPAQYGLTNVTQAAYPGLATADTAPVAEDADSYLFFDQLHPTATGHAAIAAEAEKVLSAFCYCPGTRILTDHGERPIETLAIGDRLVTQAGPCTPVRWIGRRSYGASFIAGNHLMQPVCIRAGALDADLPRRDLWVSPGHGVLVDGALVPAWRLVNGHSVVQPPADGAVDYLHIELAEHDIILAEGAPAESFLNEHGRAQFSNAAEYQALYPDAAPGTPRPCAPRPCAPRLDDGFHLQAIQRRVDARAGLQPAIASDGPWRGFVDVVGRDRVCGWVQALETPEAPIGLDIAVDGRRVMRALANRFRADLRHAGLGSGCHAFEAALPPGTRGEVTVRRSCDGALLTRTTNAQRAAA